MALILSLRQFLESSKKFKTFQNDLLNKLCNLSATDICNTDVTSANKGITLLIIMYQLFISKLDSEHYFLSTLRTGIFTSFDNYHKKRR